MYKWIWMPKEDITLWELAMALNVLLPVTAGSATPHYVEGLVFALPPTIGRHFEKVPI